MPFLLLAVSCLEPAEINTPDTYAREVIVDGLITEGAGPHTVTLTGAMDVDDGSTLRALPFSARTVTMSDDAGNTDVMKEIRKGVYQTASMIGIVGRKYHVTLELANGQLFESIPDMMKRPGKLDSVYHVLESDQPLNGGFPLRRFRVYVDATGSGDDETFIRWKFSGTYIAETLPQLYYAPGTCVQGCGCLSPLPCSGHGLVAGVPRLGYYYNKVGLPTYDPNLKCECCRCWVKQHELKPTVNDNQIPYKDTFRKIEVGVVPVEFYTLMEKYRIEVTQMSLSRNAFDYWRQVESQKKAVNSLFQPLTGQIPTNFHGEESGVRTVSGIFYASAVQTKYVYITRLEYDNLYDYQIIVPVNCDGRPGATGNSCLVVFPGSSTTPPSDWK